MSKEKQIDPTDIITKEYSKGLDGNITSVTVSVKRLIALAKYENVTYQCDVTATVGILDTPTEVYEHCLAFCKSKILAEMERLAQ